jgi:hypothetical protein
MPLPSPRFCALLFAALTAGVCLFQLALALGAPWGEFAMGGAFRGSFPPAMRVAAAVQLLILAGLALIVLARAGVAPKVPAPRALIWLVVAVNVVACILNLITPSGLERLIWAPVTIVMLAASLRVALSR